MNAISPIAPALSDALWEAATHSAQLWRATVIDVLAQSEAVVSETLLVLAAAPKRGSSVKLHQLLGQRLDELEKALKANGAFGVEGKAALPKLTAFRQYEELRAALCHGVVKVTLDRKRQWVVLIKLLSLAQNGTKRIVMTFEQQEAAAVLAEILSCGQQLSCALGHVRAAVKKPPQQATPSAA